MSHVMYVNVRFSVLLNEVIQFNGDDMSVRNRSVTFVTLTSLSCDGFSQHSSNMVKATPQTMRL